MGRDMQVKVQVIDMVELESLALENYSRRGRDRYGRYVKHKGDGFDKFLARIQVNYIRHYLSKYDREKEKELSEEGHFSALFEITNLILAEIAKSYPMLAGECKRQMDVV